MSKVTNRFSMILTLILLIIFSSGLLASAKTSKAARKHYVLGNNYYQQNRVKEAIQEWKMALEIDPNLKQAKEKIKKADYYLKHGKQLEEAVVVDSGPDLSAKEAASTQEEVITKPKSKVPMQQVQADILEIERVGGKVVKIIIGAGSQHNIRIGLDGIVSELNGSPLAAFRITAVDATKCLAEVIGLSRDVSNSAIAVINRPIK